MINFSKFFEMKDDFFIRYIHNDGRGLMNNSSLNYEKLSDDEYFEIEEEYLSLKQPPSDLHNKDIIFAFTQEGEKRHKNLINLLTKASKSGIKKDFLFLKDYKVVWNSGDGQVGLVSN